jgi:hypothetical protein
MKTHENILPVVCSLIVDQMLSGWLVPNSSLIMKYCACTYIEFLKSLTGIFSCGQWITHILTQVRQEMEHIDVSAK